jgi:hypothetical protein
VTTALAALVVSADRPADRAPVPGQTTAHDQAVGHAPEPRPAMARGGRGRRRKR